MATRSMQDDRKGLALVERRNGPYATALVEPLSAVAARLQGNALYGEAIRYYRRALHLTRINGGLYSLAQIPLLEQLAACQNALGLYLQADETHDYLYRVQQQTTASNDTDSIAALNHARWKQQMYLRGTGGETYLSLLESHKVLSHSVEALASTDQYDLAQVPHLYGLINSEYLISRYDGERAQAGLSFTQGYTGSVSLEAEQFRLLKKYNFRNGRRTLLRLVEVLDHQQPIDVQALAKAKIALGDWYLWWFQQARAMESYEEAFRLWAEDGEQATDPDELFIEPVELPYLASLPSPSSGPASRENAEARVRFRVSRHGEAQSIEVLEVHAPTEREQDIARVVLHNILRTSRFRPVVREGRVVRAEAVEREYQFGY